MTITRAALALAFALLACASAAQAETAATLPPAAKPALNLSDAKVSIGTPALAAALPPVTNRTAVEHTFGPQKVSVAAGYLCGLEPTSDRTPGPASTFGPVGTFLGAQMKYAFK